MGAAGMKAQVGRGKNEDNRKGLKAGSGASRLLSPGSSKRLAGLSTRQEAQLPVRSGPPAVKLCFKMSECCT